MVLKVVIITKINNNIENAHQLVTGLKPKQTKANQQPKNADNILPPI